MTPARPSPASCENRRSLPRPVAASGPAVVEALEDRRLLSGTVAATGGGGAVGSPTPVPATPVPATPVPTTPVPVGVKGYGVTLQLKAGQNFNGYLGVLIGAAAPSGDRIAASVNWGDGSPTTAGVVTITKAGHIDVGGSHTYAAAGTYAITVTVTAAPIPVPGQPTPQFILILGTIRSQAVVAPKAGLNLGGTLTGTLLPAPTAADVGALYLVKGSGSAGALGAVTVSGRVQLPGFVATGKATGALTLTQVATASSKSPGSITLQLTGPTEKGLGPFPSSFNYVLTGGTGAFAGATSSGTIDSVLGPNGLTFTFVIHSH